MACTLVLCVASVASAQTTWYVDDDAANDPGPGDVTISDPSEDGSLAHPFDAIQEAINAAVAGDEVLVADGTYTGTGNKGISFGGKAIVVHSENGAGYCTIDCENDLRALYFHEDETTATVVDGFTIVNGDRGSSSGDGGGVACYSGSSPTIQNCVITNCYAGRHGGGVYVQAGAPVFINCLIVGNEADRNGGGVLCTESDGVYVNCTIASNIAGYAGGGAQIERTSDMLVQNCILANNTAPYGADVSLAGNDNPSTLALSHSCVLGGEAAVRVLVGCTLNWGDGMVGDDPLFADSANGDHHLQTGSPCVDGGTNTPMGGMLDFDLEGNLRAIDGDGDVEPWTGVAATVDMGAYEAGLSTAPVICVTPAQLTFEADQSSGNPADQVFTIRNCGYSTLSWQVVEDCSWLSVDPVSGTSIGEEEDVTVSVDIAGLSAGSYQCMLEIIDPNAANTPKELIVDLRVRGTLHVPSEYATIQAAIDAALSGCEVVVADGTYTGEGNKAISFGGKDVVLRSENGPANCIIDCEQDQRAFLFENGETSAAVVDGFTITNGSADRGGAIDCTNNSRPTVRNCILSNCYATYVGGGVYALDSAPTLVNCLIVGCEADAYNGGGVTAYRAPMTLVNCSIDGNVSGLAGGGVHVEDSDTVTISNCILAHNSSATDAPELLVKQSTVSISYSAVLGGQDGVGVRVDSTLDWGDGMIEDDPDFVDAAGGDYHLQAGSPCIDAGTNDPVGGLPMADIEGAPRPVDGDGNPESWTGSLATADMGVYESAEVAASPYLCADPPTFELLMAQGGASPEDQTLSIWNCGIETLTWTVTEDCPWLSVDPNTGTSAGEGDDVTVSFDASGLMAGIHNCELVITSPEAANSPLTINVILTVYDPNSTAFYVDDDAALGGNGLEWATAFRCLQDAINALATTPYITEIRIAGGTYYPDQDEAGNVTLGDRAATFNLIDGITIQGGYRGLAGGGDADELDPATFVTVLSGGIGEADDDVEDYPGSDNTFHVVTGNGVSSSAVLAGVTITLGRADLVEDEQQGGGIYLLDSSAVFTDCIVTGNWLQNGAWNPNDYGNLPLGTGGGIYISDGSPRFTSCEIHDNHANDGNGGTWEAGVNAYAQPGGDGGGVYIADASVEFVDCTIADNTSGRGGGDSGGKPGGHGGGVYLSGTSMATFSRCTITGNSCGSGPGGSVGIYPYDWYAGKAGGKGGGVYIEAAASAEFANCLLAGNRGGNGGRGACFEENDCVQQGNPGPGGAMYGESGATAFLVNCTVADNASGTATGGDPAPELPYGGGIQMDGGTLTVANTVFWGNTAVEGTIEDNQLYNPGTLTIEYSCVEGWTGALGGDGNTGDDPMFVGYEDGDYHHLPGSPAVDGGTNSPPGGLPDYDLEGNPRVVDGDGDVESWTGAAATVDMGVYEFDGSSSTVICTSADSFEFMSTLLQPVPSDQVLSISNCGSGPLNWQITEDCDWLTADPMSGTSTGEFDDVTLSVDPSSLSHGTYSCTLLISDPAAYNSPYAIEITLSVGGEIHVPSEYGTIQAAIDAAVEGDIITVADGTYTGAGNKAIDFTGKDVVLRSENGATHCIIDCENDDRGFWFHNGESTAAVVDGITIANAYAPDGYGGGIVCTDGASPAIRNCVVTNCYAAGDGAGIRVDGGDPTFINCVVTDNEALSSVGGAYLAQTAATFVNCVIAGNSSWMDNGGGVVVRSGSDVVFVNSIIAGNAGMSGDIEIMIHDVPSYPSTVTLSYTDVLGGQSQVVDYGDNNTLNWGDGMIGDDPLFADAANGNYRLLSGSPCIDAGDNTAVPADTNDADGDGDVTERLPFDLDGLLRFADLQAVADTGVADPPDYPYVVDMGAFEYQCTGDLDGDGAINLADLQLLLSGYGDTDATYAGGDLDGSGTVDLADLQLLLSAYGQTCP